jgi:integrase
MATIRRHEQHFRKYFIKENSKLLSMNIADIDKLTLEAECNRLVKKCNMSSHEWKNVKTIVFGMFGYAIDKHMISDNPCTRLKITVRFKQVPKKPSNTQVYQTAEYESIHKYLDAKFRETHDAVYLAVKFQSYTGVRVGELVALRWEDVNFSEKTLHIVREESDQPYYEDGNWHSKRVIVPHTKTYQDRYIPLLPKAYDILELLSDKKGFLFVRNGERITERQVNYVLEHYAKQMGVATKSSHTLRKTYASRLSVNDVPLDAIQRDLGHKSSRTTLAYIYSPIHNDEIFARKAEAI